MTHNPQVSKCCGAEAEKLMTFDRSGLTKNWRCLKCGLPCDIVPTSKVSEGKATTNLPDIGSKLVVPSTENNWEKSFDNTFGDNECTVRDDKSECAPFQHHISKKDAKDFIRTLLEEVKKECLDKHNQS